MIVRRLVIVALMLLVGAAGIARASKSEPIAVRKPFASFPLAFDGWQGVPALPFEPKVLAVLGVDEYVTLVYSRPRQSALGLYIGFYKSQREGDAIHSPLNCLPGSGWQPMTRDEVTIPVSERAGGPQAPLTPRTITVNRFLIEKGTERQVVLYWYQSQGRVVANEYASKVYMVWDAMRRNRTDAALVRIVSPVDERDPDGEANADRRAADFVKSMFPLLGDYLPS
jgi:EpsI family protein